MLTAILAALAVTGWACALWQMFINLALHPDYIADVEDRAMIAESRARYLSRELQKAREGRA